VFKNTDTAALEYLSFCKFSFSIFQPISVPIPLIHGTVHLLCHTVNGHTTACMAVHCFSASWVSTACTSLEPPIQHLALNTDHLVWHKLNNTTVQSQLSNLNGTKAQSNKQKSWIIQKSNEKDDDKYFNSIYDIIKLWRKYNVAPNKKISHTKMVFKHNVNL
jgi:hypothetical protein